MVKKKLIKSQKKIDVYHIDWVFFALFAFFCYLLFSQVDIRITAEHSFVLLQGNIKNFYSACYEWNGAYAANYMPSTYIVFALWNLPLKILGKAPDVWGSSMYLIFWYKLLPICIYMISGYVFGKICKDELGFSVRKTRISIYIFYTTPIAFFSQFIFCQYDIFTVFCMLLGLKFYLRNSKKYDRFFFILFFSIATTFKYYAILIFLVLLLLRVKSVLKLLYSCFLLIIPYGIEYVFFMISDEEAFKNAVLGFNAVDFIKNCEITTGTNAIRLLPVAILILFAYAYFTNPKTKEDEVKYALYLCCGTCTALFSLMTWYPQWILFAVPFFVLSTIINKYYDVFLWLDIIFIGILYIFSVNQYVGNVDENMLRNGILAPILKYREIGDSLTMQDIYSFGDVNLLYTIMVAILIVYFIFKHPKYCDQNLTVEFDNKDMITQTFSINSLLRFRLFTTTLLFLIPALICLPSMMKQDELLWSRQDTYAISEEYVDADGVLQHITMPDSTISEIRIKTKKEGDECNNCYINLNIIEESTKKILGASRLKSLDICQDGESIFKFNNLSLPEGRYILQFESNYPALAVQMSVIETPTNDYQLNAIQQNYNTDNLTIDGEEKSGYYLDLDILGNSK